MPVPTSEDENISPFRQRFIDAANRNNSIQEFRADARFAAIWKEENIRNSPPLRVEFEHAIVLGTIAEAISMRRGKEAWGQFLQVEPLRPDDVLHPTRIVYQLKATNKMRQRWEFRDTFRNVLGRDRRLVTLAMQLNRKEFLSRLTAVDIQVLEKKLDLDPRVFWRTVRAGDKYGVDGIHAFMRRLEERTKGYRLAFPEPRAMRIPSEPGHLKNV
jgi:hypothetical protein